jgi:crotonobetainyl-CoA:carnitine CoA-transferase CaiB-like acyl-CoA transferase
VKVLDLSRLLPGPLCSWLLRGMGATVTKIEDPVSGGDYLRGMAPHGPDGVGAWFTAINAGCRSVGLDLRGPRGRAVLDALCAESDVLIESFRPGVLARSGVAPEDLRRRHPRLVVASISGFGQTGPLRALPGHDLGYIGLAGVLSLGMQVDGAPAVPPFQAADVAAGALTAAWRITAALLARATSGEGDWLDIALTDGVLPFLVPAAAAEALGGGAPLGGAGLLEGGLPAYRCYRCADGRFVAVAALEPRFAEALAAAVPGGSLTADALRRWFATAPRDHWAATLGHACVTPVLEPAEVLGHPLFRERGLVVGEGPACRITPPVPGPHPFVHAPAPALGAHTAEALRSLGFPAHFLDAHASD